MWLLDHKTILQDQQKKQTWKLTRLPAAGAGFKLASDYSSS